jgi:hypothetical protein
MEIKAVANIDTDDLTDAERQALDQIRNEGHIYLEASESFALWNYLRDHPEIVMAEIEPDVRALFSTSDLHSV